MHTGADERGAAVQIGAVILFGFVILSLATYQATVVPSQNAEVEYNHAQQVQRDVVDVRNELLDTRQNGERGYASVRLGTTYPSRAIAVNPPNPAGRLETTAERPITVTDGSGADRTTDVCPGTDPGTRFLRYVPDYNEFRNAPTIYVENTVVHRTFPGGEAVVDTPQSLVEGDTVNLVPIVGQYSEAQTESVVVEPEPGQLRSTEVTDPTVTVPTALSEDAWIELLDGEVAPSNVAVVGGDLTLDLSGTYTVNCGPVGINSPPPSGPRGSDGAGEINPAAPGNIQLVNERLTGNKGEFEIRFNNTANESVTVTAARVNYYFDDTEQGNDKKNPSSLDLFNTGATFSGSLVFRDDYATLSPDVEFDEGPNTVRLLVRDGDGNPVNLDERDFLVLSFRFESGETGTYFVPIPKDTSFAVASVEPAAGPSGAEAESVPATRDSGRVPGVAGRFPALPPTTPGIATSAGILLETRRESARLR